MLILKYQIKGEIILKSLIKNLFILIFSALTFGAIFNAFDINNVVAYHEFVYVSIFIFMVMYLLNTAFDILINWILGLFGKEVE